MIQIQDLYKSFGRNQVLKGIDLELAGSGIISILGPNGSGKTTLIKCILGMTHFDSGDILFEHESVRNRFLYKYKINHLPQIANFPENLTPTDLIKMIRDLRGTETNEEYFIEIFRLEKELNKKMSTLSGGNKQKVNLLLALMYDNPLLILDEPTSGLDPLAILNLKKYLNNKRQEGKLILITTHIMDFAETLSDRIIYILDGRIYFNGPTGKLLDKQGAENLESAIASILDSGPG